MARTKARGPRRANSRQADARRSLSRAVRPDDIVAFAVATVKVAVVVLLLMLAGYLEGQDVAMGVITG